MNFSIRDSKARTALLALALGALLATTSGCIAGDIEEDSAAGGEEETVAEAASELSSGYWNGHHYIFVAEPNDWVAAKARCESMGHYLAQIYNDAEKTWLRGKIGPEGASLWWIGYNDIAVEGDFVWVAGAYRYSNWAPGEPNNGNNNEDCTGFASWNGLWQDRDCSELRKYICER